MRAETNPAAYAVFVGELNQTSIRALTQGLAAVTSDRASHLHLMMQSSGGGVAEGIYLYNFFRAFPVELTLYNIGSVSSAAVAAYLGAPARKASATATFMIHRVHTTQHGVNSGALAAALESLKIDDERSETVLRDHLQLSDEQWRTYDRDYLWLTAADALACGLATSLGDFSSLPGEKLYSFS